AGHPTAYTEFIATNSRKSGKRKQNEIRENVSDETENETVKGEFFGKKLRSTKEQANQLIMDYV
ncbi:hypothetical protein QYM36_015499, partial [Artemia franciscana]